MRRPFSKDPAKQVRKHIQQLVENNRPTAGLVLITLHFPEPSEPGDYARSSSIVAENEAITYVMAMIKGQENPSPGQMPMQAITIATLRPTGPFWWTAPGRKEGESPEGGATVFQWDLVPLVAWKHPDYEVPTYFATEPQP